MNAGRLNLIVLVLLVSGIAVFFSRSPAGKADRASEARPSPSREQRPAASFPESGPQVLRNLKTLPQIARGQGVYDSSELTMRSHRISLGSTIYQTSDTDLEILEGAGSRTVTNPNDQASQVSGLAYDSKRHRLIVSSFGGEGYLDFYDLKTQKWLTPVSLEGSDIQALSYWAEQDKLCALELKHGDEMGLSRVLLFTPDGSPLHEIELSFPVIVQQPALWPQKDQIVLTASQDPNRHPYTIKPETGEVSAQFLSAYEGQEAALIAIYEASSQHDSQAEFTVTVNHTAPSILVLTSYEGVHWRIEGGKYLTKVIVSAYDASSVSGLPPSCKLINTSHEKDQRYLASAYEVQSSEMHNLLSELQGMGVGVTSIACAYQADAAVIE